MNFESTLKALKLSNSCREYCMLCNKFQEADTFIKNIDLLKYTENDTKENLIVYKRDISIIFGINTEMISSFDELKVLLINLKSQYSNNAKRIVPQEINYALKDKGIIENIKPIWILKTIAL